MTRRIREDGKEIVEFGRLEKAVFGALATALFSITGFIAWLIWNDHERLASIDTRLSVIEATQHRDSNKGTN